jgi:hypothetical protein
MTVYTPPPDENRHGTDRPSESPMNDRASDRRANPNRRETGRTMGDVNHTNPRTGETFGESMMFTRGGTLVADGGEADADPDDDEDDDEDDVARVGDVDHTPRENAPDASAVYERGKAPDDADEAAEDDE